MSATYRYELEAVARDFGLPMREKQLTPVGSFSSMPTQDPVRSTTSTSTSLHLYLPFATQKKPRKRPNYLEHGDRCRIIKRVDRGETQASLAREFGVTRAAICQLYKKRSEILSRGSLDDEHDDFAPGLDLTSPAAHHDACRRDPHHHLTVESRSRSVRLLLRTLKDAETSKDAFKRAAARLTFVLIEEAFARHDLRWTERAIATEFNTNEKEHVEYCGVTLGSKSSFFLPALLQIDANAQTGQIDVKPKDPDHPELQLSFLDVPDTITNFQVMLFSTSGTGEAECKAIEVGFTAFLSMIILLLSVAGRG
ncbi:hypothetical protein PsorP6_010857 [Peronosclerospora sorghi]|uniref:Uncharacterized protein n=1 Tax=Peronosclerospora sorghi TaxID=230839 RepID=A0ACC0VWU7_9STRA|nr:hypothetical protein PsorP6_010857 [Peronosclerospora sorghi]